jgi:hypothetical protein
MADSLKVVPSSLNLICGNEHFVRVRTSDGKAGVAITALYAAYEVTVNPASGSTNADGYLQVRVTCSGRCPVNAEVTFDADQPGYDPIALSVNCQKGTSLTLDELRDAVGDTFEVAIRPRRGPRDMLYWSGGLPMRGGHGRRFMRPLPPGGPPLGGPPPWGPRFGPDTFDEAVEPPEPGETPFEPPL